MRCGRSVRCRLGEYSVERDHVVVLREAVRAAPRDSDVRMSLVRLLIERVLYREAVDHCLAAIDLDPTNVEVFEALRRATDALRTPLGSPLPVETAADLGFDWQAAEADVDGIVHPSFVDDGPPDSAVPEDIVPASATSKTLADVAGMAEVKRQIERSFLAPLRSPEIASAFGIKPRGGILLYGPPGCGKTFIASAIAGEIGANFFNVGIDDVLDMYTGASERNMHDVFEAARTSTPCVLFLDEIDALGQKRSHLRNAGSMRQTVNQLLAELDSAGGRNDGVFVLGATNLPWDVDPALRRPGRFDRMLLVAPPDADARAAIVRSHLDGKPVEGIDLAAVVAATDGFSGADVAYLCDEAAKSAMDDSMSTGNLRYITNADILAARSGIEPSTAGWFETARTVVEFGNNDGAFDDLATYMQVSGKKRWRR